MTYLGCPYSANPAILYPQLQQIAAKLHARKFLFYSPILHWHDLATTISLPTHADFWWPHNMEMLDLIQHLTVLKIGDWEQSKGLNQEIQYSRDMGYCVDWMDP